MAEEKALEVTPQEVQVGEPRNPHQVIDRAVEVATALKGVVESRGLILKIRNRYYPLFEAWGTLASFYELIPDIEWTHPLIDSASNKLRGFEARARLVHIPTGREVSHAEAECLFEEENWADKPEFQVRSMAQTRAAAKVCRIALSRVMVLAGYEPTPAEEMNGNPEKARQRRTARPTAPVTVRPGAPEQVKHWLLVKSGKLKMDKPADQAQLSTVWDLLAQNLRDNALVNPLLKYIFGTDEPSQGAVVAMLDWMQPTKEGIIEPMYAAEELRAIAEVVKKEVGK